MTEVRVPAAEQAPLAEDMWARGASQREIADELGVSTNHLSVLFARWREAGHDLPYRRSFRAPRHEHLNRPIESERLCTRCKRVLPLGAFPGGKRADGTNTYCIECDKVRLAESQRKHRDRHAQRVARWRRENPEKSKAHWLVAEAVQRGELGRPDSCSGCGEIAPVQAHHHDYAKPLDVRWLCIDCHNREHVELRATGAK